MTPIKHGACAPRGLPPRPAVRLSVALLAAALLGGCFDGGSEPPPTLIDNAAPVANAGADQTVFTLGIVNLSGAASSDADGDIIRYQWSFVARPVGSSATLAGADTVAATFTPDVPGAYTIQLEATDGFAGSTDTDTVTVTATAPPPVASAGPDQSAQFSEPSVTVQLDGSGSSDPGGSALTYAWTITGFVPASGLPPATPAALVNPAAVNPTLPITEPDQVGTYTLGLTVSNGSGTANDTVTVTVGTIPPPVASAGDDQEVSFPPGGVTVQLDGTASSDPSSLPLTFAWEITGFVPASGDPPAVPAALVGATTATPSFDVNAPDQLGTYTLRLTVSNGTLGAIDEVTVEVAKSFPAAGGLLGSAVLAGLGAAFRRRLGQAGRRLADVIAPGHGRPRE
jgi:PKD repeat protein